MSEYIPESGIYHQSKLTQQGGRASISRARRGGGAGQPQPEAWESGRDSLLWAIHELDRIDKHRLLLSVVVIVTGIGLYGDSYELAVVKKYSGMEASGPLLVEPRELTSVEEGRVLFGSLPDFGATGAAFFYDVALKEPPMMRDKPAVTWLRILADRAEKVIKDLAPLA